MPLVLWLPVRHRFGRPLARRQEGVPDTLPPENQNLPVPLLRASRPGCERRGELPAYFLGQSLSPVKSMGVAERLKARRDRLEEVARRCAGVVFQGAEEAHEGSRGTPPPYEVVSG